MSPETLFPVSLKLDGKRCLVLGGGPVALAKLLPLMETGAVVTVCAQKPEAELEQLAKKGSIRLLSSPLKPNECASIFLAIDSGESPSDTALLRAEAKTRGFLLNSVDQPDACDYFTPAVVRRGPVQIAISTGGAAPALARNLRQLIERVLPQGLERLVIQAASLRPRIQALLSPIQQKGFWNHIFTLKALPDHIRPDSRQTRDKLLQTAQTIKDADQMAGEVWLVGAGAGAADLISLRGLKALESADVVLHDALIDKALLEHARRDARIMAVGKRCGRQSSPQEFINRTMVNFAQQGLKVVRLKCGDPFIFGRGGEELEFLKTYGITATIVPGVTAASVAAAETGIPLTHRGMARRVTFMTAATNPKLPEDTPDWKALLNGGTVALYMSKGRLPHLAQEIKDTGVSGHMPLCIISNAGLPGQCVHATRLDQLTQTASQLNTEAPLLTLVGETTDKIADRYEAPFGNQETATGNIKDYLING